MSVLIIGGNKLNDRVREYFSQKGLEVEVIDDVCQLRSLSGEAGAFTALTKDGKFEAELVILTEQPAVLPLEVDSLSMGSIYDEVKRVDRASIAVSEPVVFLLDYEGESTLSATIAALRNAAKLAKEKRKVYYIARFIRSAGRGIEMLYNEARSAGVYFIKFEDIQISGDTGTGEFTIKANDGVLEHEVRTKTVYADGRMDVTGRYAHAAEKLGLTLSENGLVTEDRYFLTPVLTSRCGVFHISPGLAAESLDEGLDYIFSVKGSPYWGTPPLGTAKIDGLKCVLCYNCYRACTHAALEPDMEARQMKSLQTACAGCGTCASICPGGAIKLEKEQALSRERPASNKTLAYCCENSAANVMDDVLAMFGDKASSVEVRTVACGGRVDFEHLSSGLLEFKSVVTAVCHDDACKHFDGNKRACAQADHIRKMLETAGLRQERIRTIKVSHAMPKILYESLLDIVIGGKSLDNC